MKGGAWRVTGREQRRSILLELQAAGLAVGASHTGSGAVDLDEGHAFRHGARQGNRWRRLGTAIYDRRRVAPLAAIPRLAIAGTGGAGEARGF